MGSKFKLVHQGQAFQQHNLIPVQIWAGAIIAEVQPAGNLCWATQCFLLRVLSEISWFWAKPPSTAATTLVLKYPWNAREEIYNLLNRVPFTKEKMLRCPCPFKNKAYRVSMVTLQSFHTGYCPSMSSDGITQQSLPTLTSDRCLH